MAGQCPAVCRIQAPIASRVPSLTVVIRPWAVDPELGQLVDRWLEEAINDVEDALQQAGRFQPHQRHFRGVLAMAELDFVAQHWEDADWHLTRDQMLDELTDSWVRLLGR